MNRPKINEKEAGLAHFFKKTFEIGKVKSTISESFSLTIVKMPTTVTPKPETVFLLEKDTQISGKELRINCLLTDASLTAATPLSRLLQLGQVL